MNKEEFITKFYSCDDEEQFLKDVYHNLNCLQQENQQLKIQISAREEEYRKLDETNKILSQELTKDKILKQEHLKTCCGISIGDIPKFIYKYNKLEDNWNKLKEIAKSQSGFKKRADLKGGLWFEVDDLLDKMQELEQGSDK